MNSKKLIKLGWYIFWPLTASLIVYGTTYIKPYSFTVGGIISSTEVNTNFDDIYTSLNKLAPIGFAGGLSADQSEPSGSSGIMVMLDAADFNDGNFDTASYQYTVATGGVYNIFSQFTLSDSMAFVYIFINSTQVSGSGSVFTKKLNSGDIVDFRLDTINATNTPVVVNSAQSFVAIKKVF